MSRRPAAALILALLILGPTAHAELNPATWRPATAAEKAGSNPNFSNLFFVLGAKRELIAYAGYSTVDAEVLATDATRANFLKEVVTGAQESGLVLKDQTEKTVNGCKALECSFESKSGAKKVLALFCLTKDRMVTLSVLSKETLAWDDPDVVALVKELPIK